MPSDPPSSLDLAIVDALIARTPFADVRVCPETASTNADAAALLGESPGTTILAEMQTAGVGRTGRAWHAPRSSSLLFTTLLPESIGVGDLWATTFWTALAVAEGIERACGVRVDLKWPNDLLLARRKLCGILCISRVNGDRAWVGCGVGLNVHRPADAATIAAIEPAPAFLSDSAPQVERSRLFGELLRAFERMLPLLARPDAVARAWDQRAEIDGTPYRLRLDRDGSIVEGIARGLGRDGALRIVTSDGSETEIHLADAHVLR